MKNNALTSGFVACLVLAFLSVGCERTGKLSPELQARFEKEGIAHRADDLTFRRTRRGPTRCRLG